MKILAVIPARGGSRGIPRKNMRLLNNHPLIHYSIFNALNSAYIQDVVVTSDDNEILDYCKRYSVNTIKRDAELSGDFVTLDPVIFDAADKMEQINNVKYDAVITMQPTSPLLQAATLDAAISHFIENSFDSIISVVNKAHLSWGENEDGYFPKYNKRLNRQQLQKHLSETGAFFISRRDIMKKDNRLGDNVSVYEISEQESIDIDSFNDWVCCETLLKKKKVVFRADGYNQLGLGHIHHCLTLAYNMIEHDVMFVTNEKYETGMQKIIESKFPYHLITCEQDFFDFLSDYKPDIIVNDCLDTKKEYILTLKEFAPRVVTIEDLGEGALYADAVINALYEAPVSIMDTKHFYWGEKYICLRDEFLLEEPKPFSPEVKNVFVMFGGSDPSNFTGKLYEFAQEIHTEFPDIKFTFIAGLAYDCDEHGVYDINDKNIKVIKNTKTVSAYMKSADIAFTSQGRSVFEIASLGVPAIVMSHNERENLHSFAQMQNGFLNLGLGKDVSIETIKSTFRWMAETPQIRSEMRRLMLMHDLKSGVNSVKNIIIGK